MGSRAGLGGQDRPRRLEARIGQLRRTHLAEQRELIGSAVDDFLLYDMVLETAMMLGILPAELDTLVDEDPSAS